MDGKKEKLYIPSLASCDSSPSASPVEEEPVSSEGTPVALVSVSLGISVTGPGVEDPEAE